MIVCVECHTEAQPDPRMGHLRLCFWCAELQRLNPHPTRPLRDPDLSWSMRPAERR